MVSGKEKLIIERTNKIEEARKFSQHTLEVLSKKPIDWDTVFNNIEVIGTNINEALELLYRTYSVNEDRIRDQLVEIISDEHEEIKDRIVSKIKEITEGDVCALPKR